MKLIVIPCFTTVSYNKMKLRKTFFKIISGKKYPKTNLVYELYEYLTYIPVIHMRVQTVRNYQHNLKEKHLLWLINWTF